MRINSNYDIMLQLLKIISSTQPAAKVKPNKHIHNQQVKQLCDTFSKEIKVK